MSDAHALRADRSEGMMSGMEERRETTAPGTGSAAELVAAPGSRRMRLAQWLTATRIELKRQIVRRRALGAMVLALVPVMVFTAWVLLDDHGGPMQMTDAHTMFAVLYQGLMLSLIVFFGCVVIFSTLIRREMRDRTLHYHFLAPVRREVLLVGKYTAGVLTGWLVFGLSTLVCFALAYTPYATRNPVGSQAFFFDGPGFAHLAAYLGVTALAVLGYGAVFLTLSMFFKNPVFPALAVYGWEFANFLLPAALKKISVIHYLVSLLPVPVDDGPFALLAESASPWLAVPGLVVLSAVLVGLAAWRLRRTEVLYGED